MPRGALDISYCMAGVIKGFCKCKNFDPETCDPDATYCMEEKE
jgi:hypothetical protein